MHFRPSSAHQVDFKPMRFGRDFPVSCGRNPYTQTDKPITSLHVHNCLEVGYCYSGSGIFVVENKIFSYGTGDVSIINDREAHLAQSTRGTVSKWTFISLLPEWFAFPPEVDSDDLRADDLCGADFANVISARDRPELSEMTKQLALELQAREPGYRTVARGLIVALLARFHRLPGRSRDASAQSRLGRVAPALKHMAGRYAERIMIDELASRCHMSETNFRRTFKSATGRSPYEYLTRLRTHMAGTMLRNSDMKVLAIAMETGFPTLSSFNRSFKSVMGVTPREWRAPPPSEVGG